MSRNALSGPASTWTDRSKGLPGRTITQISVDPGNPLTAVVSIGGFNANTTAPGHIFRTTDGGATWTDITGSLPDVPADDVVIDPDIPGTIYAATDLGAFYTANNGTLWSVLGAGLPRVAVMGLRLHRQARILRAGTFGRGMWDISVPAPTQNPLPVLSSLAPPISAPGSGAFTLTVNGIGFAAGSVVQWNGSGRATTITGPTSLTAAITAADVAGAGTAIVTVFSPLPGGGTSNGLGFTIGATIAAPTLTAVSPPTVTAGSGDYLLTVSGTGFVSGSTLNWNGSPRPSTPLSATQLGAAISAADIKAAGTISVTVTNPTPGGGVSNPLSEFVTGASASSTFAGAFWSFNGSGVTALNAPLGTVAGLAVDATGNLFVSDMDNCIVFKLAASGTFAPVAGSGNCVAGSDARYRLASPSGLAIDSVGNLYINDVLINRVVRLNGDSTLTRVAGNGFFGYSGDGDAATKASIGQTNASAFDAAGNLYIAETIENRIRKVDKSGNISTFAGSGQQGYSGDGGPATSARLSQPFGVATDAAGNVYIADTFNHVIRKVASNGTITTVAGTNIGLFGGDGGPATKASIALPKGVATDAGGNLYIADTSNNRIRKVDTASGIITTVAGNGAGTFAGDGGPAASASLFAPVSIALDAAGNLYIADGGNKRVRKVASGVISTIAGNGNYKFAGDGGSAASANFNAPQGVLGDRQGNVFVADTGNNRIRKIDAGGTVSTIAGNGLSGFSGDGGPATAASFSAPMALARDLLGNIYVADQLNSRVRRITSGGTISTFAGGGGQSPVNGSTATAVAFNLVNGVASDGVNVFIAAGCGAYMVASDGKITVLANGFPFCQDSGDGGPASTAGISLLAAIGVDGSGNVYLGEYGKVRRIGADGKINTVAGGGPAFNADGSLGAGIRLNSPGGLTVDASGNVFFTDSVNNDRLYLLSPAGNLTTILGGGQGKGFVGLQLAQPHGVTVDAQGNLYVADTGNDRIVKLTGYGAPGAVVVAPTVTAAGIVNGASFATDNVVSPWSIASLFGLNLSTGTGGAATVPLPTNLNGTQLLVNGAAAPLYFTSSGQVNFQIPVEAAGTSGTLAVVSQGATSSTVALKLAPTSPGIFSASPGGTGQGAVLNQDFSANSSANPAARGSVIQIFATGLGATTPPVVTGQAGASSPPFNNTVNSPTVLINGQPAVLQFSAAAPGFVGLYQVNATVPNIPSGTATLQIQSGGRSSKTVLIAVK